MRNAPKGLESPSLDCKKLSYEQIESGLSDTGSCAGKSKRASPTSLGEVFMTAAAAGLSQSPMSADVSLLSAADVGLAMDTNPDQGLSSEQAAARLLVDGLNQLRGAPPVASWRRALAQLRSPLIYLLGVAAAVALAAWWFEGRGHDGLAGWPLDAIVILCVILLNATLGWMQDTKAAQAVAALAKLTTATSAVLRNGQISRVSSTELVMGDVLVLPEGDAVGADARLMHAAGLMVLEASLTGESEAVLKDPAVLAHSVIIQNLSFQGLDSA